VNLLGSLVRITVGVLVGFGVILSITVQSALGLLLFLVAGLVFLRWGMMP